MSLPVFIVPGLWVPHIRAIFLEAGYKLTAKIEDAGIVVWTGGADVSPALYGEKVLPGVGVYTSPDRDKYEVEYFNRLPKQKGPLKVGICRGAQLLCALSGGKLWQNVEGHAGDNHDVIDTATGECVEVSSLHHQEMIPPRGSRIWAKAGVSIEKVKFEEGIRFRNYGSKVNGAKIFEDIEACYIPQTESFCFQPHPEIGPVSCTQYFFKLIDRALIYKAKLPEHLKALPALPKPQEEIQVSGLTDSMTPRAANDNDSRINPEATNQ